MAFINKPSTETYTVSGGTSFPFEFKWFNETDIEVFHVPQNEVSDDTIHKLNATDYSISSNASKVGGTIAITKALTDGDTVTINRNLPVTRLVDYATRGDFEANTVNDDQDYQSYLLLDYFYRFNRFLSVPVSSGSSDNPFEFPPPFPDSYLKWDDTGSFLENETSVPDAVVTSGQNAAAAQQSADDAEASNVSSGLSATSSANSALEAMHWANYPEDQVVPEDGTEYSAKHYAAKAKQNITRTSARNTAISASASGVLALATTPTPSFATVTYTGNGTSNNIVTGRKSYDPNWVSGRAYSLANEQDAYCIYNYYIYKLLADVTSATTPDVDPTHWEVVPDGVSVPWFNSQVWIKNRTDIVSSVIVDTLRGTGIQLNSDTTAVEVDASTGGVQSFNADGFSVGLNNSVNGSGDLLVAWQEQYDTMVSGTTNHGKRYITAYNAQSGKFMGIMVGSGTAGHQIPHGVGTKPDFLVVKNRDAIIGWPVYNSAKGATEFTVLDDNLASTVGASYWNDTEPTSEVFTVGTGSPTNALDQNLVFYGSSNRANHTVTKMYQGTGAAGNVVDLGLDMTQAGAKVMIKRFDSTGDWYLYDNVRSGGNSPVNDVLYADLSNAEGVDLSTITIDFTSTGVVLNGTSIDMNASGGQYLIEATVPNYDKPNGGLDIPAGSIISYAEGTDGTTGDLDSIETTTLASNITMSAGTKNYIRIDKGNTVSVTTVPLEKVATYTGPQAHDVYDVSEGIMHTSVTGAEVSRVYLGEVVVDGEGLVIPDTLVEYPVAHQDVTSLMVYGDMFVNGYLAVNGGFDLGQTWFDELSNRLGNVKYKNDTGKTIVVSVSIQVDAGSERVDAEINGTRVSRVGYGSSGSGINYYTTVLIVPPEATYEIIPTGAVLIQTWAEYK